LALRAELHGHCQEADRLTHELKMDVLRGVRFRIVLRSIMWVVIAMRVSISVVHVSCDNERPTQNWHGQGESDCLIKTKHCDGL
jgi:hypothetical protein